MALTFGIGFQLALFTYYAPMPTNFWPANFLVVPAVGAIAFLVIAFVRQMIGKDKIYDLLIKKGFILLDENGISYLWKAFGSFTFSRK